MANCVYFYNGNYYGSYQALVDSLKDADLGTVADILFSQDASLQGAVYDKIHEANAQRKFDKAVGMMNGEPDIAHDENTFTTQTFIDSQYFKVDGKSPMFQLSPEDYIERMKETLAQKGNMTQQEIDEWADNVTENWDTISQDSYDLHSMLMMPYTNSVDEWGKRVTDTSFASIPRKMMDIESQVSLQVWAHNGRDKVDGSTCGQLIKGVNLEAPLHGMDGKKLLAHIDYLIVKPNGDIEIFNVKTSTEPYEQWSAVKVEKYKYQMALIAQVLAHHGVDTSHIRLNIIPVQLKYNNNFDTITDVNVQSARALDFRDTQYVFRKYNSVASQFVESTMDTKRIDNSSLLTVSKQLQHIFPGKDVAATGISQTAKEWVESNWKYLKPKALPDGGYEVTLPDSNDPITLSDSRRGANNQELVSIVQERINQETAEYVGSKSAYFIHNEVVDSFKKGRIITTTKGQTRDYITRQFSKYFENVTFSEDGKIANMDWQVIESPVFTAANLIVIEHKTTHQVDVFAITGNNPNTTFAFRPGRKNLLGAYLNDLNLENFEMKSTYGNIDAIRAVALLNEVLPDVGGNIRLGQLQVLSTSSHTSRKGAIFEFDSLLKQWDTIVRVVNKNTPAGIENKLRKSKIGSIAPEEVLRQAFNDITGDLSGAEAVSVKELQGVFHDTTKNGIVIPGLLNDNLATEVKIERLEQLRETLTNMANDWGINIGNPRRLLESTKDSDKNRSAIAKLYLVTTQALASYYGDVSMFNEDFSSLQEYIMKPVAIGNSNVRRVVSLTQKSIDNIRNNIAREYTDGAMPTFANFYVDCGYTSLENSTIGSIARTFNNLYVLDADGKNTFVFKNPYDPSSDLKPHERRFLKDMLYRMYKVKCDTLGKPCDISGVEDPKLRDSMPDNYLWVPLQKASRATNRMKVSRALNQTMDKVRRIFRDPKGAIEEAQGMLTSDDADERDEAIDGLRTYNPYTRSLMNTHEREMMIAERGEEYFETNVENIFIDMLAMQTQCEEFSKLLSRIKGIELALILRGDAEGNSAAADRAIKTIDDYVSMNVYNKSIMEKTSQKIDSVIAPLRRLVSTVYIAMNITGAVRDTIQGLEANFVRAAIKFGTDINAADVAFGYEMVMKEGVTNIMSMSKLNQFNLKYAFSNFDAARIADRLKTGRGGLLNVENWLYWTLRAPDYLNRMVLFIAQLHHDGAFNAYTLDENHRLKYNWRLDKRFDVLASGDKTNPEYNKQLAKYMSLIRAFNIENPKLHLDYADDLPDAYTPTQIRKIKSVGESIYGAYDLSSRCKAENIAVGRNFMFFFTWMNGMVEDYFKSTQLSATETMEMQETDYDGNPLFFTADRTGNMTTEDTGLPITKDCPVMVQGVFQTFRDGFKAAIGGGGWSDFKDIVWSHPSARRNVRRLLSDMSIAALLTLMFKLWLDPMYKEHKKNGDGEAIACNLMYELIHHGAKSSYDVFSGPIAIIDYFGESTRPASFALQSKILSDAWKTISGQQDLDKTLMNSQAFFRSMRDTYAMYKRDHAPA